MHFSGWLTSSSSRSTPDIDFITAHEANAGVCCFGPRQIRNLGRGLKLNMYKRIFPQLLLIAVSLIFFSITPAFSQESLPELVRRVKPQVVAIATYDSQGEAL